VADVAPPHVRPGFAGDRFLEALGHLRRYENAAAVDAAIGILESLGESADVQAALARAYLARRTITGERVWAERAIEASRKAAELEPTLGPVRETRGRIALLQGLPAEAAAEFRRAIDAQPYSVEAWLGLGRALDRQGRAEEAAKAYGRAIEIQPGWWSTHSHLGVFLLMRGDLSGALESLKTAVSLSPDNTRAIDNLGIVYQQLGRHEEAIVEYRRSIAIRPTASALSNLGTCLFFLGRYAEAAEAYERATSLQPDDGVLWMNLGDALRWRGGDAAAVRAGLRPRHHPPRGRPRPHAAGRRPPDQPRAHARLHGPAREGARSTRTPPSRSTPKGPTSFATWPSSASPPARRPGARPPGAGGPKRATRPSSSGGTRSCPA
jgi:tetratricopeptide (TPR) repeat protein